MAISTLPSISNDLIDCTAAYCNVKFEAKSIQLHNWYMTAILAKKLKLYHKETQETITEKVFFFCFAILLFVSDWIQRNERKLRYLKQL